MNRLAITSMFALALSACAANAPAPTLTPPSPAIVAMVRPPVVQPTAEPQSAATSPLTVHQHAHWALTLPTAWKVDRETDSGLMAQSDVSYGKAPITVIVDVESVKPGSDPVEFAKAASVMSQALIPEGVEVVGEPMRKLIKFKGQPASVTLFITNVGAFMGVLAEMDPKAPVGAIVACVADLAVDGTPKVCGDVQMSLELK